jgi:hypothetical protein
MPVTEDIDLSVFNGHFKKIPESSYPPGTLKGLPASINLPTTCSGVSSTINSNSNIEESLSNFYIGSRDITGAPNLITNLTTLKGYLAVGIDQAYMTEFGTTTTAGGFTTAIEKKAQDVITYIDTIQNSVIPSITFAASCLSESLEVDNKELNQAQAQLDESKERYESIKNPETNVSYYEGWFPIVRPMSEGALFGLFGAAIFMLLLSIFIFLRLAGVVINIQIPEIILPEFLMNIFTLPPNSQYYILGGIIAGIFGGIGYSYYLNRK